MLVKIYEKKKEEMKENINKKDTKKLKDEIHGET
jgi:hypothetical protein